MLAAPLGALALSAQAADIASTLQGQQQFSTLAKAIESAGIAPSLQGEGPYTVFAPTNQAFEQLPQGALDALMKQENQGQLKRLLQYHVVEGKEIRAKDAIGKQADVDTASGDRLSVDGTGQMVLLVPTGLTVTWVGDQVMVERDMAAVEAPAVEVAPAGGGDPQQSAQGQQQAAQQGEAQTQVAEESGMPTSEHQQEVLATEPATEQQQTTQDSDMPSSPHQEQVLRGEQAEEQQAGQESAAEEPETTGQDSDMPSSPHQEQVLATDPATDPATEQQQTAQDSDMPSSPHQEQVLRGEQAEEQQGTGMLREATVVEPDIQADNGVIHAIDSVLVPQSVLSRIEKSGSQQGQSGQSSQSGMQQSSDKQG